jgi:hypothetical protein
MTNFKLVKNRSNLIKLLLAATLIILAILFRVLPHPPNFTPLAAIAIFSGAIFSKKWAACLPLTAMIISDFIIGLHPLVWVTWGSFLVIAVASNRILQSIKLLKIVGTSLGASFFFFVTTNFGVWLQHQLYPASLAGLIDCYYNALPFFRNTLLGDLVFSAAIFGTYYVVCRYVLKNTASLKIAAAHR